MPKLQTFEAASGYTIHYRVLPLDIRERTQAAIRAEWARSDDPDKRPPEPPATEVETGPGQRETKIHDTHPDHLKALAAYDAKVSAEQVRRITAYITEHAIVCEVDADEVARVRANMRDLLGVDISDESDRHVFLWRVAVPDTVEQQRLTGAIYGEEMRVAVEAAMRSFRRKVEGEADRVFSAPPGTLELQPGA